MSKTRVDYTYNIGGKKKHGSFEIDGDRWEDIDIYDDIIKSEGLEVLIASKAADKGKPEQRPEQNAMYKDAVAKGGVTGISPGTGTRL